MLKRLLVAGLLASSATAAGLAFAATLNGFEIETDPTNKNVQVTLNTSQKATVTTEKNGNQFSIILDNTELSQEQLDKGLPVVLDNQNKFIGRAVPTADGKVKVIIPNLPANEYSIAVSQQYPSGGAPAKATPVRTAASAPVKNNAALTPRSSAKNTDNQFESIAKQFPEPVMPKKSTAAAGGPDVIKLSPSPSGITGGGTAVSGGYPIWNPYVVSPGQQPMVYQPAQSTTTKSGTKTVKKIRRIVPTYSDPAVNAMSYQDPGVYTPPPQITSSSGSSSMSGPALSGGDPLAILHSIPPFGTEQFTGIPDLSGQPVVKSAVVQTAPIISVTELKAAAKRLPWWVYALAGVFFGGVGLFTLIGAVVLLKLLMQGGPRPIPAAVPGWGQQVNIPNQVWAHAPIGVAAPGFPMEAPEPSPEPLPASVSFEDTAAVNPFEYLKNTSADIKEAVHNTLVLKFPNDPKRRRLSAVDDAPKPIKKRKRPIVAAF